MLLMTLQLCVIHACRSKGTDEMFAEGPSKVERISGEVFLSGPDEARIAVDIVEPQQREALLRLLQTGTPTGDRKAQGRAVLKILYSDSHVDVVEVAEGGLFRVGRNAYHLDESVLDRELRQLLQKK